MTTLKWYNTRLSTEVEHGFHALALDEARSPFSPTLWERLPEHRDTTDLRQVWFPGSHINVGGGEKDQGVSNITLACESTSRSTGALVLYGHETHTSCRDDGPACLYRL